MKNLIYWFLIYICSSLLMGCGPEDTPSDQELINNFQSNREAYEKVLKVFLSEPNLDNVEINDYGTGLKLRSNLENVKFNKQDMFNDLQKLNVELVKVVSRRPVDESASEIQFISFRTGIVSAGRSKGVAYFRYGLPNNIDNDLDKYDPPINKIFPNDNENAYLKIEGRWYLFSD